MSAAGSAWSDAVLQEHWTSPWPSKDKSRDPLREGRCEFGTEESNRAGLAMSVDWSISALFRRAATFVDKILKGAKPADLPVEQPAKFDLVVNLKTAKALNLSVPPVILLRADKVIE